MIRRRLFWKILLAFLVTYLAITQAIWLATRLEDRREPPDFLMRDHVGPAAIAAAAHAVQLEGPQGLARMTQNLPRYQRDHLALRPVKRNADGTWHLPAPAADTGVIDRVVDDPQGRHFLIRFSYAQNRRQLLFNMPPTVFFAGLLAGLVFSSLLAWYLMAPITKLRRGFAALAQGDLSARVTPRIGRRRDEIADLSRDFDLMAGRLKQLVERRDRLLHDVSHELRSPLTRVQLAVALARQTPERVESSLDRIESEVYRLDALVGELLTLARAENQADPGDDYFDIAGVTQSVVEDVRYEAQPLHVTVNLSTPPEAPEALPLVRGNSELASRAIENVLRNALRFSPEGGSIDVTVEYLADRSACRIRVADEGPGVTGDVAETMFEPFVRAESGASSFGLGLAIASRAIAAHGGTITAANRAEGGLLIEITLPAHP